MLVNAIDLLNLSVILKSLQVVILCYRIENVFLIQDELKCLKLLSSLSISIKWLNNCRNGSLPSLTLT